MRTLDTRSRSPFLRPAALLIAAVVLGGGCGGTTCPVVAMPAAAAGAALWRVSVYTTGDCVGGRVVGGGLPVRVGEFAPSGPLRLDVPPGASLVQLLAFGDAAGTQLVAEGCARANPSAHQTLCLDIAVFAVDASVSDATGTPPPDLSGPCTPLTHQNGLGATYSDCAPLGTHTEATASEACAATTGSASLCKTQGCSGGPGAGNAVCATVGMCTCWTFSGSQIGVAHRSQSGGCSCGMAGDPTWD